MKTIRRTLTVKVPVWFARLFRIQSDRPSDTDLDDYIESCRQLVRSYDVRQTCIEYMKDRVEASILRDMTEVHDNTTFLWGVTPSRPLNTATTGKRIGLEQIFEHRREMKRGVE